ncbi:hypothetical protein J4402_05715 [Candidatus Pacearchaeota archaeon]|nr:hypothetical protein [Candidatus Pacearchaeota archaeon]
MKSKAEITTTQIILIAIFLVVLVIVLVSLSGGFRSAMEKLGILASTPNMTQPAAQETQIFRFNTQTNEVEYYDGANIIKFQNDAMEFKDKTVSYKDLSNTFYNFYNEKYEYAGIRKLNERTALEANFRDKIYTGELSAGIPPLLDACVRMMYTNGNILISLVWHEEKTCQKSYGDFLLNPSNNLQIQKVKSFDKSVPILENAPSPITNSEAAQIITDIGINWRYSILKTPINLPYTNATTKQQAWIKTCVDKRDFYLIADLNNPKSTCS